MRLSYVSVLLSLVLTLTLAACGGNGGQKGQAAQNPPADHTTHSGATQNDSPPSASAPTGQTQVNVAARDFAFTLDKQQIKAGSVTFVVRNDSSNMPHDFAIRGNGVDQKTAMIHSGQTATLTVDLKPGAYTYLCTIPGHEFLGMKGSFTVTP